MINYSSVNEPLIYTSRGNVPVASLRYEHKWVDNEDVTTFSEAWIAEDGEVVKSNSHTRAKRMLTIGGEQAAMA